MSSVLLVDSPAPHVARFLLNRPDKRNAIDVEVRTALREAIPAALASPDIRAIVLGGTGGVFSAGGDVATMVGLSEADIRARMTHIRELCLLVASIPVPVVSAVEGFAAGGAVGLALLGDVIVVGDTTKFLFPFFKLGLVADWGLLHTLPLRVGLSTARRLLMDGRTLSGREAVVHGLADELASGTGDVVMEGAIARATELSLLPQDAFARMKRRLAQPTTTLAEELAREEDDQAVLLRSADFAEGFAAFRDKRTPRFLLE